MVTFSYIPATEGTPVGGKFQVGVGAAPQERNILSLDSIPDGTLICNIEKNSGDGGKLIKSAGSSALVFAHGADGVTIKFPSGKFLTLNPKCRAMIGVIAGGGRKEKPFLKAGNRHKYMRAHRKLYPTVRGIAQGSGLSSTRGRKASTYRSSVFSEQNYSTGTQSRKYSSKKNRPRQTKGTPLGMICSTPQKDTRKLHRL